MISSLETSFGRWEWKDEFIEDFGKEVIGVNIENRQLLSKRGQGKKKSLEHKGERKGMYGEYKQNHNKLYITY